MKVLKPDWVNHNGMPICSIDIHPDGSRVATGGQGEDSGRIVIWNMAPIIFDKKEMDENVPRMLCQLDNHLACVNCVRWSSSGKYLASGGDDKLVMVWTISKSSSGNSVFGGKGKVNLEGWRCVWTLRSHQGDVLDMAWSPNDHWLATCSVDNTVIVWRADNLPEVVAVLKGHTGLVKGVSWDPVGKYLSSQSDDKSVRIWRTGDWHQEAVIRQPFENCSGTTLVLRLSWSPDGQYLVTAHAMNGTVPTAQIIDRDGWSHDTDFVGHHMAVTCVRFSSFIMESERKGKVGRACACAIGSRDRSVSVWVTSLTRPIVVLEDLFSSPVNDLSWGPRGLSFMACSNDGTTAYLEFTEQEIGTPITETDKCQLFEKLYGKAHIGNTDGGIVVIENPEVLQNNNNNNNSGSATTTPTKHNKTGTPPTAATTTTTITTTTPRSTSTSANTTPTKQQQLSSSTNSSPAGGAKLCAPTNKQIETRRADGRRRITPIYIPPAPDTGEEVVPFGSDSVSFSSMCSANKSHIVIEKRDELVSAAAAKVTAQHHHHQSPTTPTTTTVNSFTTSSVATTLTTTMTTPTTTATVMPPVNLHQKQQNQSPTAPANSIPVQPKQPPSPPTEGGFTSLVSAAEKSEGKRKRGAPSLHQRRNTKEYPSKRQVVGDGGGGAVLSGTGAGDAPAAAAAAAAAATLGVAASAGPPSAAGAASSAVAVSSCKPAPVSSASSPFLVPSLLPPITFAVNNNIKISGTKNIIQVENSTSRGVYRNLTSIRCVSHPEDVKPKWEVMLGSEVCGCVGTRDGVAVACCDRTLHLFNSDGGERLLAPLALSSALTLLWMRPAQQSQSSTPSSSSSSSSSSSYLVCVTCDGHLNVWSLSSSTSSAASCSLSPVVSDASIAPLITASNHDGFYEIKIKDCLVSDDGEPMLALSSGKAYIYSIKHRTWLLVANSGDPVVRNVFQSFKSTLRNPTSAVGNTALPLKSLQAAAFNGVAVGGFARSVGASALGGSGGGGADVGALCTLSYLDSQLMSAKALNSSNEYRFWLMALVRFLLQQGMEGRLRRICEELLGPRHTGSLSNCWEKEILGLSKHSLLSDILGEMSANLKSQRLYMEFKDQLDNCH